MIEPGVYKEIRTGETWRVEGVASAVSNDDWIIDDGAQLAIYHRQNDSKIWFAMPVEQFEEQFEYVTTL
jgi:hypothetical protein